MKGEVKLNPINVISTSTKNGIVDVIQISATPFSNDVIGLQDLYLQLDMNNTNINMVSDRISSGNDVSGSNYIVSSSHGKTSLVRGTPIINTSEDMTVTRNTVSNRGLRSVVNTNNTTSSSSSSTTTGTSYSY